MSVVEAKNKKVEVIREKSYIWGVKTLQKLEKLMGKNTNISSKFGRDKYVELYGEIE